MIKNVISLSVCALIAGQVMAKVPERKLYVGSNSTEAIMEFNGVVEMNSSTIPQEKTLRTVIESQLEHIVGPMSEEKFTAVPKGDHDISAIKIISKTGTKLQIGYHYKGTVVVENGPVSSYPVTMPINPKSIYKAAMVGTRNPCTDDHYQTEGDFWYFWNPKKYGCKLVLGKDYTVVNAKIKRMANTTLTYPEYQNLADKKGIINIHLFFGLNEAEEGRNPLTSNDINADNYRTIRTEFINKGYTVETWTPEQVNEIAKTLDGEAPFVETLSKGNIKFRFVFAPTGIDEEAKGFHWFYKDAIENSSIMIYSGHSGLGGHLDLESIESDLEETINFNPNKYQIFFFDSCTSYRYYNSQYLDRKITDKDPKGTKSLDIFVNGLSTLFSTMPNSIAVLSDAVEKSVSYAALGKGFVSYQSIAKQIDSNNLFGIVGDEDNATPKIK